MTQPDLLALLDSSGHPPGGFSTKDGALDAFEEMRAEWVAQAREVARRVCAERGEVTADDIHARFPMGATRGSSARSCAGHASRSLDTARAAAPNAIDARSACSNFAGLPDLGIIERGMTTPITAPKRVHRKTARLAAERIFARGGDNRAAEMASDAPPVIVRNWRRRWKERTQPGAGQIARYIGHPDTEQITNSIDPRPDPKITPEQLQKLRDAEKLFLPREFQAGLIGITRDALNSMLRRTNLKEWLGKARAEGAFLAHAKIMAGSKGAPTILNLLRARYPQHYGNDPLRGADELDDIKRQIAHKRAAILQMMGELVELKRSTDPERARMISQRFAHLLAPETPVEQEDGEEVD